MTCFDYLFTTDEQAMHRNMEDTLCTNRRGKCDCCFSMHDIKEARIRKRLWIPSWNVCRPPLWSVWLTFDLQWKSLHDAFAVQTQFRWRSTRSRKIIRLCFIISEQWNAMENTRLLRVNQSERTPFILWFQKMSIPPSKEIGNSRWLGNLGPRKY